MTEKEKIAAELDQVIREFQIKASKHQPGKFGADPDFDTRVAEVVRKVVRNFPTDVADAVKDLDEFFATHSVAPDRMSEFQKRVARAREIISNSRWSWISVLGLCSKSAFSVPPW